MSYINFDINGYLNKMYDWLIWAEKEANNIHSRPAINELAKQIDIKIDDLKQSLSELDAVWTKFQNADRKWASAISGGNYIRENVGRGPLGVRTTTTIVDESSTLVSKAWNERAILQKDMQTISYAANETKKLLNRYISLRNRLI